MKKITFLYLHNFEQTSLGIQYKIIAQINALENLGASVTFVTIKDGKLTNGKAEIEIGSSRLSRKLKAPINAGKLIGSDNDYLHIRGIGIDPFFLYFLHKVKKKFKKIIYEIPTYPYDDELSRLGVISKFYLFLDKISRTLLKKYIDLIVNYGEFKQIFGIKSLPIINCIDVEQVDYTGFKKESKKINFIGVAQFTQAHGYDRLIEGIFRFYKDSKNSKYDVTFDIIGTAPQPHITEHYTNLISKYNLSEKITLHGALFGQQLTNLFRKANFGVGALAMHRINLKNGSILKVREYFARGLPFVIAYDDIAIRDVPQYYYSAPADNSPIDIKAMIEWYEQINFDGHEMRSLAIERFSWEKQFKKIFDLLEIEQNEY
jgi:glycosyltransferase involved in cell wall biosynthesis